MVLVWDNGKLKGWWTEPGLANGINNRTVEEMGFVLSALEFINRKFFRRVHITASPAFLAFNPVRDIRRQWQNSVHTGRLWQMPRDLLDVFRSLPGAVVRGTGAAWARRLFPKSAELVRAAEKASLLGPRRRSDFLLGRADDPAEIEALVGDALQQLGQTRPELTTMQRVGDWTGLRPVLRAVFGTLETISDVQEAWAKVTQTRQELRAAGVEKPADLPPAAKLRVIEAGTPDWAYGGTEARRLNSVLLYGNVAMRGWAEDASLAFNPKTAAGWWFKATLGSILPKALMAAAVYGMFATVGDDGEEEDEAGDVMRRMSRYDRTNYILLPLSVDENGRGWALRIPDHYTGQLIGAMFYIALEAAIDEDAEVGKSVQSALAALVRSTPGLSPVMTVPHSILQYATGENPYDSFRGRPVFTDREMDVGGEVKRDKFIRFLLGELGLNAFVVVDTRSGRPVPTPKTWQEKARQLPIIGPIASRFLRITDYGLVEAARDAEARETKVTAERWYRQREVIDAAVSAYFSEQIGDERGDVRLRHRLAYDAGQDLADTEMADEPRVRRREYARRMERTALVAMRANGPERAVLNAVAYAPSHKHATAAVLKLVEKGLERGSVERWLDDFEKDRIISKARLREILDALE